MSAANLSTDRGEMWLYTLKAYYFYIINTKTQTAKAVLYFHTLPQCHRQQ